VIHWMNSEEWECGDDCLALICKAVRYMYCSVYRACLGMIAKASGTGFRAGVLVPTHEHGLL
jgi:hypothetical protein